VQDICYGKDEVNKASKVTTQPHSHKSGMNFFPESPYRINILARGAKQRREGQSWVVSVPLT